MSNMDSEQCWGEASGCDEEYDCGPDSGVLLPAVYRLDPAQVRQHTNQSFEAAQALVTNYSKYVWLNFCSSKRLGDLLLL